MCCQVTWEPKVREWHVIPAMAQLCMWQRHRNGGYAFPYVMADVQAENMEHALLPWWTNFHCQGRATVMWGSRLIAWLKGGPESDKVSTSPLFLTPLHSICSTSTNMIEEKAALPLRDCMSSNHGILLGLSNIKYEIEIKISTSKSCGNINKQMPRKSPQFL